MDASRQGHRLLQIGVAAFLANLPAGAWGVGSSIVPMAAGGARGSAVQEAVIDAGLRSAGAALIAGLLLVLSGLRGGGTE